MFYHVWSLHWWSRKMIFPLCFLAGRHVSRARSRRHAGDHHTHAICFDGIFTNRHERCFGLLVDVGKYSGTEQTGYDPLQLSHRTHRTISSFLSMLILAHISMPTQMVKVGPKPCRRESLQTPMFIHLLRCLDLYAVFNPLTRWFTCVWRLPSHEWQ